MNHIYKVLGSFLKAKLGEDSLIPSIRKATLEVHWWCARLAHIKPPWLSQPSSHPEPSEARPHLTAQVSPLASATLRQPAASPQLSRMLSLLGMCYHPNVCQLSPPICAHVILQVHSLPYVNPVEGQFFGLQARWGEGWFEGLLVARSAGAILSVRGESRHVIEPIIGPDAVTARRPLPAAGTRLGTGQVPVNAFKEKREAACYS